LRGGFSPAAREPPLRKLLVPRRRFRFGQSVRALIEKSRRGPHKFGRVATLTREASPLATEIGVDQGWAVRPGGGRSAHHDRARNLPRRQCGQARGQFRGDSARGGVHKAMFRGEFLNRNASSEARLYLRLAGALLIPKRRQPSPSRHVDLAQLRLSASQLRPSAGNLELRQRHPHKNRENRERRQKLNLREGFSKSHRSANRLCESPPAKSEPGRLARANARSRPNLRLASEE
jgi:hypothetical protein